MGISGDDQPAYRNINSDGIITPTHEDQHMRLSTNDTDRLAFIDQVKASQLDGQSKALITRMTMVPHPSALDDARVVFDRMMANSDD